MLRRQVLIIQTYGQLMKGERPHLFDEEIEFLVANGYAVPLPMGTEPPQIQVVGPSETQRIGPSEAKQTKKAKRRNA